MTQAAPHPAPAKAPKPKNWGSEALTPVFNGGVRVGVLPEYLPQHSETESHRWVFAYRIRITNECEHEMKLVSRRWEIIDADGDHKVVQGLGVVGEQPVLAPGQSFSYSSGCELATPWGTMEGTYHMQAIALPPNQASGVNVRVARFFLVSQRQ